MKKVISVFLAVLMVVTAFPLSVFANQDDETTTVTQQEVLYNGTNALSDIVANEMNLTGDLNDSNYFVQSIEVEGQYATVNLSAPDDSTLVVAVYDENSGIMTTSGKTDVDSSSETVSVNLENGYIPEYFTAKAFLVDSENSPVCKSYTCVEYTVSYKEFFEKNIYDFDEERVINLDYNEDFNFAVVADNAEHVEQSEYENILTTNDHENGIYVFEDANSAITSLDIDDVLYFTFGEGEDDYILTKIGSVENNDGTVTITASDEFEISDFFSYIKIDSTIQPEQPQTFSMARGASDDSGNENKTSQYEIEPFSLQFKNSDEPDSDPDKTVVADKDVNYDITLSCYGSFVENYVKFYYDINLFGEDAYQFEYNMKASFNFELKIDIYGTVGVTFYALKNQSIPVLPALDLNITIKLTVSLSAHVSATGKLGFEVSRGIQKHYDKKNNVDYTNQLSPDINPIVEFSGKVNIQFDIVPVIEIGFKIFKVFTAAIGVEGKITTSLTLLEVTVNGMDQWGDKAHCCTLCFDVETKIGISVYFKIGFNITKDPEKEKIIVQINPVFKSFPVKKWHLSLADGKWLFEPGECENYLYRVDFFVLDEANNPVENVSISIDSSILKTDGYGKANGYYVPGTYNYKVEKNGYSIDTSRSDKTDFKFVVFDGAETVNIYLKKDNKNEGDSSESYIVFDTSEKTNFTLSGILKTEDYVINSLNYGTVYILDLDDPIYVKIYDDFFEIDGEIRYIDSVQINESNLNSMLGKHITVTGEAMLAHTGHHLRTILLLDCEISEFVNDSDNFVEPDFAAFEDMLHASVGVWNNVSDFSKLSATELLINYVTNPAVPIGLYTYFTNDNVPYAGGSFDSSYSDPYDKYYKSYELDADLADWILLNVFNVTPDRSIYDDLFYYCNDKLYIALTGDGFGDPGFVYDVIDYELYSDGNYRIQVDFKIDYVDNNELISIMEFVAEPKYDETYGNYWCIKSCKDSDVEIVDSGECGQNLTWTLYDDGYFIVSGTGDMNDWSTYDYLYRPWFEHLAEIEYVYIEYGVEHIGDVSFYQCENLKDVDLPDSLKSIGYGSFEGCSALEYIFIPKNVSEIDPAFCCSGNLKNISVSCENLYYADDDGVLFNKDFTELIRYPSGRTDSEYTVPASVTKIGADSFSFAKNIEGVILSQNTVIVDEYAFCACSKLNYVLLPTSIELISDCAFMLCDSLKTVYYTGSKYQWSSVSIESKSELNGVDIVYNYQWYFSAYSEKNYLDSQSMYNSGVVMTETICNAVVGDEYLLVVAKDYDVDDLLSSENLIYIDQKTADSETLSFNCSMNDYISDYSVVVNGQLVRVEHSHVEGDWEVVFPAEPGIDGLEQLTCSVCGEILDERIIPALDEVSLGDVNGDGKITAADARLALRISAQIEIPTETQLIAADLTGDGKVTAADARKILRISAGLEELPSDAQKPDTNVPEKETTTDPEPDTKDESTTVTPEDPPATQNGDELLLAAVNSISDGNFTMNIAGSGIEYSEDGMNITGVQCSNGEIVVRMEIAKDSELYSSFSMFGMEKYYMFEEENKVYMVGKSSYLYSESDSFGNMLTFTVPIEYYVTDSKLSGNGKCCTFSFFDYEFSFEYHNGLKMIMSDGYNLHEVYDVSVDADSNVWDCSLKGKKSLNDLLDRYT